MNKKAEIMDRDGVRRAIVRISHEIAEHNHGVDDVLLIGIKRRGVSLAKMIRENIEKIEGITLEYEELDITLYRDDLTEIGKDAIVGSQQQKYNVNGKKIVVIDDVLFTGRTVRAAIDCIMDMGRPKCIQLAVLIDRGHRELPIRADYVGKNVPTSTDEVIKVSTDEFDGELNVELYEK